MEEQRKQYKLIKEYPGSPNQGTVVIKNNTWLNYRDSDLNTYRISFVENYPEYWREIEEDFKVRT